MRAFVVLGLVVFLYQAKRLAFGSCFPKTDTRIGGSVFRMTRFSGFLRLLETLLHPKTLSSLASFKFRLVYLSVPVFQTNYYTTLYYTCSTASFPEQPG